MHINLDHSVALAIVAFGWIMKIATPPKLANLAGWVVGVLVTVVLLLVVLAR